MSVALQPLVVLLTLLHFDVRVNYVTTGSDVESLQSEQILIGVYSNRSSNSWSILRQ